MYIEKNYFWIPPLLGGLISLIALFTPATYKILPGNYYYIWMWGLLSYKLYDSTDTLFTNNVKLFIPSIICSILVFIFAIIIIISANMNRTGKKGFKDVKNKWYGLSVLVIITTATWMIIYEVHSYIAVSYSWWKDWYPGFGVIGIFLGAIIIIMGIFLGNYFLKQKERVQILDIGKQEYKYP